MPKVSFAREFRAMARVDWAHLFELKRRWKVSVAAIIRRAFQLELLGAVQYRRLYKSLSANGWRTKEPHEPPEERPELMTLAVERLADAGTDLLQIAKALGWRRSTMEEVTGFRIRRPLPDNVESLARRRAMRIEG
jgi:Zn-dependent peptidase ImmA (M78 family)